VDLRTNSDYFTVGKKYTKEEIPKHEIHKE
jgi:hypothetical protein